MNKNNSIRIIYSYWGTQFILIHRSPLYLCSGYGALTQLEKYKPEDGNENKNIDINFLEMTLQGFNGGIMLAKANKDEMLVEFFHEGNKNGAEKPMHSLVLKNRNKK